MSDYPTAHVREIGAGDRVAGGPHDVPCTILRDPEPGTDLFGRETLRFWSRREDTGQEGSLTYGPTGFVRIREPGGVEA